MADKSTRVAPRSFPRRRVIAGSLALLAPMPLAIGGADATGVAAPGASAHAGGIGVASMPSGTSSGGAFDRQVLGWANAYKEGDEIAGLAAPSDAQREAARTALAAMRLSDVDANPLLDDDLHRALQASLDKAAQARTADWTFAQLKSFLLEQDEASIKTISCGLSSDVIGCVVKLMSNTELTAVSAKIFNPLPGSRIGAKGYLGARIQPNSPTDNPEDIRWQVFDGWSYAVGDLVLGTNPVSSEPEQVHAVEVALQDILRTFGLEDTLPHCVLAHVDVQAEVEQRWPGSTALWFQSIAGSVAANATFDLTLAGLLAYADQRKGRYGMYFETGQGADFTNGHAQGMDMVLHESRKYGLARLVAQRVAVARGGAPWVHLNDVAGFIGPEVFRTRDQLVRCCLEDLVMGKLHGLCLGLDICSTLHMDVTLDDLDWCQDSIVPAQPAYLMALPTKIDPMLGYLTTGFQDHVRLRERFGLRIDDRLAVFFKDLGILDAEGRPTARYGDPLWVYLQYRRRKGDTRSDATIRDEGSRQIAAIRARGVFIAQGYGASRGQLAPKLATEVRRIYDDGKRSIRAEFDAAFRKAMAGSVMLSSQSRDRDDYILHPATGEVLDARSVAAVETMRKSYGGRYDVQIVVSDGLNALALNDASQRDAFLTSLRADLVKDGLKVAPGVLVVERGRVRTGYRIGETLFGGVPGRRAILNVIGERPGTGHRAFSVYMTVTDGGTWGKAGKVDHDITRVVAGIANTALAPAKAADDAARILKGRWALA